MGIFSDSGRIGQATFSDLGGAVNDLFSFEASGYKAKGAELEAASYREAATLAGQNAARSNIKLLRNAVAGLPCSPVEHIGVLPFAVHVIT